MPLRLDTWGQTPCKNNPRAWLVVGLLNTVHFLCLLDLGFRWIKPALVLAPAFDVAVDYRDKAFEFKIVALDTKDPACQPVIVT